MYSKLTKITMLGSSFLTPEEKIRREQQYNKRKIDEQNKKLEISRKQLELKNNEILKNKTEVEKYKRESELKSKLKFDLFTICTNYNIIYHKQMNKKQLIELIISKEFSMDSIIKGQMWVYKKNNKYSGLNARKDTSITSEILFVLKPDIKFEVLEIQNDRFKINCEGKIGWISKIIDNIQYVFPV
jgi:hypothetical protein